MESSLLPSKLLQAPSTPHLIPTKLITPLSQTSLTPPPPPAPKTTHLLHSSHLPCHGKLQDAILALEKGSPIKPRAYISLLQSCIDSDSIDEGRRLHKAIDSVGDSNNPFVETKLVSMYAKCGSIEEARKVFREMRERNLYTWSAMVGGCAREQRWEEVIELFFMMMVEDGLAPDGFLLPKVLQACGNTGNVETGKLLHSLAVRGGFLDSLEEAHVANSVLGMYAKCGDLDVSKRFFEKMGVKDRVSWNSIISGHCQCGENEEALRLFGRMRAEGGVDPSSITWNIMISSYNQAGKPDVAMNLMKEMEGSGIAPDVFTWTSMISGFAQNKRSSQALDLFVEMQMSGVEPNDMTIASAISATASLKESNSGRQIHSYAVKIGAMGSLLVGNSLVDMYAKCGRLEDAHRIFDAILEKDVFTWNSMIGGYAQAGYIGRAYDLFLRMEDFGIRRNVVTWNVMISGYIQNGDEDRAMELFERMETDGVNRNTASWNGLIAGSLQNGNANKALKLFRKMQSVGAKPNSVTVLSILPACANLVSARKVREIHACVLRGGLHSDMSVANALIGTYSKSGDLGSAQKVFSGLSSRDHISWNSMIGACVLHGYSQVARDLFHQMRQVTLNPNQATLASMINSYSLDGMVDEGKVLFSSMIEEYDLAPGLDHYSGMVDLFGRSGRLREAVDFIEKMPIEPDSSVWNSLFSAARIHGNLRIACLAVEKLIKLEPRNPSIRHLLLRMNALGGKTKDVSQVRWSRREGNVDPTHGCCWMEVGSKVQTFLSGGKPSKELDCLNSGLNSMAEKMPGLPDKVLDIEEEEDVAGIHSEKQAIAYALLYSQMFRVIQIVKSVRMCLGCHTAAKFISKVYRRDILLKDPNCLHHFRDGKCSCRDYW